jgi:lipoteichoic acid synthase
LIDPITRRPDLRNLRLILTAALAVAAIATAGCRRLPPPPYERAFTLQGAAPRVLQAADEVSVPLTVVNSGRQAWDPSRVHLSYHWLWVVPREIAARSRWDLPYHDGIRSDLPAMVPPGGVVPVQGRVLAPDWPGLYWLQWDMVEEGVAWFAQSSPRQRRSLVVVSPPIAWIAAPIPLLIAIAGLRAVRRRQRFAGFADVAWCASALALKPLIVVHDALLEPSAVAYWLFAVTAFVPPALGLLLLPRRVRVWTLVVIGIIGSVVVLGDVVYYRFFGDVLSAPAALAARQTAHVWGSIRSLLSPLLLWIVIDCPVALWLAVRLTRQPSAAMAWPRRAAAAAAIVVVLAAAGMPLSVRRVLASTPLDQMFRDRAVVEHLGLFGFHAYDGWNYARSTWLRPGASDAEVGEALAWFVERAPSRGGPSAPSFGAARGRNLIVIQVESLQDYVVDFRVGDQDVMPHLRRWVDESLRFTNVTDETSEGRTSDAEFTTMTSLLPLDHGAVAFRYPGNHYSALPSVLAEQRYATLSAVAFEPGFWNRRVMHPSYGFGESLFEPDFQLTEQIGWGLNDRDFLQQMVPHLEKLPEPFAAWLITLSLHHPFDDFPAAHKSLRLGTLEGTSIGNYLHTMRFFDDALEAFKQSLAARGLLDRTMIVVFGDHDAGFPRSAALARTLGIGEGEAAWALADRVPLFVRVPGGPTGVNDVPAGQTDFAPTLLSLLGVDASTLPYVGRNLLGTPGDGPVPRPYGDWIDRAHLFFARGAASACYDRVRVRAAVGACDDGNRRVRREREVSRLVVASDLQARLRDMMRRSRTESR